MGSDKTKGLGGWYRRMIPRSPDEPERTATSLELLFDLASVVAIARAAEALHHEVAHGHFASGTLQYLAAFFAIWWAWMNFTWFASAYDCDDVPYRIGALVQLSGALAIAAGIGPMFDQSDFRLILIGYTIMRAGLIFAWARAAISDRSRFTGNLTYALGLVVCQTGWIVLILTSPRAFWVFFVVLVVADAAVPIVAEKISAIPWHRGHITERYGLFTIIVLGETLLSIVLLMLGGYSASTSLGVLLGPIVGGVMIVFSLWWLYFDVEMEPILRSHRAAFLWGYGHYILFAAIAAVGAGIALVGEALLAEHPGKLTAENLALAIPVAIVIGLNWILRLGKTGQPLLSDIVLPLSALVILGLAFVLESAVFAIGVVSGVAVAAVVVIPSNDAET